jgi:hypothetical protein
MAKEDTRGEGGEEDQECAPRQPRQSCSHLIILVSSHLNDQFSGVYVKGLSTDSSGILTPTRAACPVEAWTPGGGHGYPSPRTQLPTGF